MTKTTRISRNRERKEITCKKATSLISAYVEANLSSQTSLLFEEHLRVCPDCVAFLNTYKKTLELAKSFLAADAPAQVHGHRPAGHAAAPSFLIPTRTRSAAEPVASVRSSDIGTSAFMLGACMSFA